MTKLQRAKRIAKFLDSCEREIIPAEPNETEAERNYRLEYSTRARLEMVLDSNLHLWLEDRRNPDERGTYFRLWIAADNRVASAAAAVRREKIERCIREGRQ